MNEVGCLASWLQKERKSLFLSPAAYWKSMTRLKVFAEPLVVKYIQLLFLPLFCLRARLSFPFNLALATLKWTWRFAEKIRKNKLAACLAAISGGFTAAPDAARALKAFRVQQPAEIHH
jgi:hypothetical protein